MVRADNSLETEGEGDKEVVVLKKWVDGDITTKVGHLHSTSGQTTVEILTNTFGKGQENDTVQHYVM